MGFEPMIPFWGIHTFQACAIDQLGHLSIIFVPEISVRNGLLSYKIILQTLFQYKLIIYQDNRAMISMKRTFFLLIKGWNMFFILL